jgi:hypothetical protein
MWLRKGLLLLFWLSWQLLVRLPAFFVRAVLITANLWAWHVIVFWLLVQRQVAADRAGFALATLLLTPGFRPRLFLKGFALTAGIYATLTLIVLILLWCALPIVTGLMALVGGLRNDLDFVLAAGGLFVYGLLWLCIIGKVYTMFALMASMGSGSSSSAPSRDREIATEGTAHNEARAQILQDYRQGL